MDSSNTENVIYVSAVLTALFTIPSVLRLARSSSRVKVANQDALYEDVDGAATEESMAEYSTKAPFITIFTAAALGLATAFAEAVFVTIERGHFSSSRIPLTQVWLLFAAWILLLVQLIDTAREVQIVERFQSAVARLASCFMVVVLAWTLFLGEVPPHPDDIVIAATTAAQILAACAVVGAIFNIQRRPDVFRPDGRVVERQFKGSLWTRYTFSWSAGLLDVAATKSIENSDLPAMDAHMRSKESTAKFRSISLKDDVSLWKLIFWAFRVELLTQWTLIIISTLFDVAPQLAMLKLLQYLEARKELDLIDPQAWLCVLGLFGATVGSTLVDYRITWLMWSDLAVPIRSVLTGLIFEKMMKVKDCSVPPKLDKKPDDKETPEANGTAKGDQKEDTAEKPARQSQQDIINMFAVDTNLVGMMGANNQFYIMFLSKLIVAVVFLWLLIGWESLLAGMATIAVLFPINQYLAKRYGKNQRALMKARDKKTSIISEVLQGIRQIKFSAIEQQWTKKIEEIREEELSRLWLARMNNLLMFIGADLAPILLTASALATYSYIHGTLLPSVAFTALGVFMQLEQLLGMLPFLLVMGVNAKVSCDRIQKFLLAPEKPENTHPGDSISFHNASVSFPTDSEEPSEDRFVLRDISLEFPNNALSVISGATGAGKSLLLAAILGEVEVLGGYIQVPRPPPSDQRFDDKATAADWILPTSLAFVSQTPWIENATIKNNILFGLPFDPIRYDKVIKACALTQDLAMFDDGDETEVGAQGISLSGGQKWRLTLARAFYSRAGILVLDDVFSALDAHVGKEIYDNALMGELSEGRTRILVTHHVSLCLPRAKYAVRLSARGVLEHAGLTEELRQSGSFENILEAEKELDSVRAEVDDRTATEEANGTATTQTTNGDASVVAKAAPKKLVEDEKRETGRVKKSVYFSYLKASGGIPFWSIVVLIYAVSQALTLGRSWWIKIWTASYEESEVQMMHVAHHNTYGFQTQLFAPSINSTAFFQTTASNENLVYYLSVYIIISLISVFFSIGRFYTIYLGSFYASRKTFQEMTYSVLRTPLRWLDTVPTGRILNRFTADFQSVDSMLSQNFAYLAGSFWQVIGILAAAAFVSPFIILLAVILLVICGRIAARYLSGARSIKRLESIQKSPMISHFSASLSGLSTIRAFSKSPEFVTRMYSLIDKFATVTWHNWLFNNWFGFRMSMIGSMFSAAVAVFIVSTRGIDASLAGFALAFALEYAQAVKYTIRLMANTELDMNAAERIFEYRDLEIENQDGVDNLRASWPEEGKVEVEDLEVGYAEGLPSILKGLTFTAEMNQRIGVVGRTGAGKSTLSLALFRFLEARKGSIKIDNVDISTIKLHDLRTRLAIIPQDPVLFSGTIRSNLDPFDQFTDFQLREALARVHLTPSTDNTPVPEQTVAAVAESSTTASSTTAIEQSGNINIFLSLASPIASGGSNLSQGQKQLLCLARAILSRPKVLLLDEATSAVDMATDILIQRSIREEFANTTLLVVAHRLSTVADFDRILVMRDGVAAEYGTPRELLDVEDGVFKDMVAQSGEKEELERTILRK